jgi:hypothetical protein
MKSYQPPLQESADNILFLIQDMADAIMGKKLALCLFALVGQDAHLVNEQVGYAEVFLQHLKIKREDVLHQISQPSAA